MTGQGEGSHQDLSWALHDLAVSTAVADTVVSRRLGLSAGDYLAMKHVLGADPPIGPVELGRLLGISSGSATSLVDRLERAGYVRRHPHPGDRRRLVVRLSDDALDRMHAALLPLIEELDSLATGFGDTERATVHTYLTMVVEAYRNFTLTATARPRDGRRPHLRTRPD